eukprot:TRINITY_DN25645_c0_g1_i1.p1 TRINITY_DN25645_c0_g1~~TRINITY_DN25645_c0_g1_i1.p1  ORF type:complete len:320 (+),score=71.80 TRINITY_DN25645_c0_g1_i1:78-962(+)
MARPAAALALLAAAAAGDSDWLPGTCSFRHLDPVQAGNSVCCTARHDLAPVDGAQYRFVNASFTLGPIQPGCSAQGCWHYRISCDSNGAARIPAAGSTCGNRGRAREQEGSPTVYKCDTEFSICLDNDDPSKWPAEYCAEFKGLTFVYAGQDTRGPPSFLTTWGPTLLILTVIFGLAWVMVKVLTEFYPQLGESAKWPIMGGSFVLALLVAIFPRFVAEEWKAALEFLPFVFIFIGCCVGCEVCLQRAGSGRRLGGEGQPINRQGVRPPIIPQMHEPSAPPIPEGAEYGAVGGP